MNKDPRFINVTPAMEIAGVSRPTMIKWCTEMRIGLKVAGRWLVDKEKLLEVLKGARSYGKKKK